MQANSEISVLQLTNDRFNRSGLLLLSTFFVSCWAYYNEGRHLSLSLRRKITVNVFYSTFKRFFIFVTFFTFSNVFYFEGNVFFIYVLRHTTAFDIYRL